MSEVPPQVERRFSGTAVSRGIVRAKALVWGRNFEEPERRDIREQDVDAELKRFEEALKTTRLEIVAMQRQISEEVGSADAGIFDAHVLMLEDRTVLDEVVRECRDQLVAIDWVFYDVMCRYMDSLRRLDDGYLRERVIDIEDVARRVIRHFREDFGAPASAEFPHIVLSHELTPSDTATMDRTKVRGFVTEIGSATSHTAIMARSLNLPAVVGIHRICEEIRSGEDLILDGYNGVLIASPDEVTDEVYRRIEQEKAEVERKLERLRETKCCTSDGRAIILSANVEVEDEMHFLTEQGAEGIGLYRTEFIFLNSASLPSEDEQAAVYSRVAAAAGPDGVIFRTFDLGGDKLPGGEALDGDEEPNPFLGCRGIRLSLARPEMFRAQLRAILRASACGRVGVMFPLVSGLRELQEANRILADCMEQLQADGVPFDPDIEIGAMIEVPSAALTADMLAPHVDFFSIGTNDLVQYTIAVDRVNETVASLYQPFHPAVLRLLKRVVEAAKANGIWAGVCGEMAGDVVCTPLLVGLGIDELSVGAGQVLRIKAAVQQLDSRECVQLFEEVLHATEPEAIEQKCRAIAEASYRELLD